MVISTNLRTESIIVRVGIITRYTENCCVVINIERCTFVNVIIYTSQSSYPDYTVNWTTPGSHERFSVTKGFLCQPVSNRSVPRDHRMPYKHGAGNKQTGMYVVFWWMVYCLCMVSRDVQLSREKSCLLMVVTFVLHTIIINVVKLL